MILANYITDYTPVSEQERVDQANMLRYISTFDDVLTRDNIFGHFTSSGFITNANRDKILFIHHNIYKSWGWTGGHMDGSDDFLAVALREAKEETGLETLSFIDETIASLDILDVPGHMKNNNYISAHVHLSLAYILEADERDPLFIKADENSGVQWFPIDTCLAVCSEPHMRVVYKKLLNRLQV